MMRWKASERCNRRADEAIGSRIEERFDDAHEQSKRKEGWMYMERMDDARANQTTNKTENEQ